MSLPLLEENLGFGTGEPRLGPVFPPIVLLHLNWREGREGTSDGDGGERLSCLLKKNYSL